MSKTPPKKRTTPSRMLPLVMLIVLLAAVFVAWLMVRAPQKSIANAAAIIGEMRQKGLGEFWSDETERFWYVTRLGGRPVGWSVRYRQSDAEAFEGGDIAVQQVPNGGMWEGFSSWRLSRDAKRGRYEGRTFSTHAAARRQGQASEVHAVIELTDGRLKVHQSIDGEEFVSGGEAPAGYIPEGTRSLALALTARRKTEAMFRMIVDSVPPQGSYPTFMRMTVAYLGPPPENSRHSVLEVTGSQGGRAGATTTYVLDPDGDIVRQSEQVNGRTLETVRSTQEEVFQLFPSEQARIRRLLKLSDQ